MSVKPQKFSFLLLPEFTLLSYISAIEVLRHVNRMTEEKAIIWETLSLDGAPVKASNGMIIPADKAISESDFTPWLCICSDFQHTNIVTRQLISYLNMLDRFGAMVGGCCSGTYILAKAGLLTNIPCTIHWEYLDSIKEEFPDLDVSLDLHTIHKKRFTCSGGAAMLDLMLVFIEEYFGQAIADESRCQLLINRSSEDRQFYQRSPLVSRSTKYHPTLVKAVELIENNLEEPLSRTELAKACNSSIRNIERLFQRSFKVGPAGYYVKVRLKKARNLLLNTNMPISEIALACGFNSSSYFSRRFREEFNISPLSARSQYQYTDSAIKRSLPN